MAIISQETFEKFTKEEKNKIREDYSNFIFLSENGIDEEERVVNFHLKGTMEEYFGEENLQLKIKTWEDIKKAYPETYGNENIELFPYNEFAWDVKLINKNIATLKIAKLIELSYGGMVTEEEWKLSSSYVAETRIWTIVCQYKAESKNPELKIIPVWSQPRLLSFHTKEQAEEFMSYESNRILIKQYHMV